MSSESGAPPPAEKRRLLDPAPTRTTVVRLRRQGGQVVQDCDVYIGRAVSRGGWELEASKWANPFSVARCGSAGEAIRQYTQWLLLPQQELLLAALGELKGKVLGCWCKPGPCHGDVLAALANAPDMTQ
jgi:hypothetical protein